MLLTRSREDEGDREHFRGRVVVRPALGASFRPDQHAGRRRRAEELSRMAALATTRRASSKPFLFWITRRRRTLPYWRYRLG